MTDTGTNNLDNLQYQKALIDQQKEPDPQTNGEVHDLRTITVTQEQDTINIRVVPQPSVQNESQCETS